MESPRIFCENEKKTPVDRLLCKTVVAIVFVSVVAAVSIPHRCRCDRFGSIRCLSALNLFAFSKQVSRISRKYEMFAGCSPFVLPTAYRFNSSGIHAMHFYQKMLDIDCYYYFSFLTIIIFRRFDLCLTCSNIDITFKSLYSRWSIVSKKLNDKRYSHAVFHKTHTHTRIMCGEGAVCW